MSRLSRKGIEFQIPTVGRWIKIRMRGRCQHKKRQRGPRWWPLVPSPAPQNKQPKTRKETEPLETQNIKYQSRKKRSVLLERGKQAHSDLQFLGHERESVSHQWLQSILETSLGHREEDRCDNLQSEGLHKASHLTALWRRQSPQPWRKKPERQSCKYPSCYSHLH